MRHHFAYLSASEFYNWGCSSCCSLLSSQLICHCPLFYIHVRDHGTKLFNPASSCPLISFLYIELCKKKNSIVGRNFKLRVIYFDYLNYPFLHRNKSIYAFKQQIFWKRWRSKEARIYFVKKWQIQFDGRCFYEYQNSRIKNGKS